MKSFLIIGLGEFGKHLALKCSKQKNEVCAVDTSKDLIDEISDSVTKAFVGDCMKKSTLTELGVNNYDICVVAIGKNFQASLEITSNLKELGAKYIIAKVSSELQSKFLLMAGANEVVYPERESAIKLATTISNTKLIDFVKISKDLGVYQIKVAKNWVGKCIEELQIRQTLHCFRKLIHCCKYSVFISAVKKT